MQFQLMRTTFGRFDKRLFLKVHRDTIVYYFILNSGSLTKFSLILEDSPKAQQYTIILILIFINCGPLTGASLILEKLFSGSSFYDLACFSILASGSHLDATITSDNIFRSSIIDANPILDHLYGCFSCFKGLFQQVQDSAYSLTFKLSFIAVFLWMVHNNKLFRRSSIKYQTFSEGPT